MLDILSPIKSLIGINDFSIITTNLIPSHWEKIFDSGKLKVDDYFLRKVVSGKKIIF